jgi:hypothetical protein
VRHAAADVVVSADRVGSAIHVLSALHSAIVRIAAGLIAQNETIVSNALHNLAKRALNGVPSHRAKLVLSVRHAPRLLGRHPSVRIVSPVTFPRHLVNAFPTHHAASARLRLAQVGASNARLTDSLDAMSHETNRAATSAATLAENIEVMRRSNAVVSNRHRTFRRASTHRLSVPVLPKAARATSPHSLTSRARFVAPIKRPAPHSLRRQKVAIARHGARIYTPPTHHRLKVKANNTRLR